MRIIYSFLHWLLLPFILFRLRRKARKNPAYLTRWQERLGVIKDSIAPNGIWIHAVSVGESLAIVPLIIALRKKYPTLPITITNQTPTGAERIHRELGHCVTQHYAPYDLPLIVKKFLKKVKPKLLILVETELWPNYLHYCHQLKIKVILLNARLAQSSARRYGFVSSFTRKMLANMDMIAAQTQEDSLRFQSLGMPIKNIDVTGNIKFDRVIPSDLSQKARALRQCWGEKQFIWVAASTHAGEEKLILKSFAIIKEKIPDLLLVLVPRHPERFQEVYNLCHHRGWIVKFHRQYQTFDSQTQIVIGDCMGELLLFYAASDLAFVGGSLVKKGGQNPLEPALVNKPIIVGPYTDHFQRIVDQLAQCGALLIIKDFSELAHIIIILFNDINQRNQMGRSASDFILKNKGALQKQLKLIEQFI
jgi:3-deoxy-D-manno-octulosonic-acid transferase